MGEKDEATLPADDDADAYIELMRDAYIRQLRQDADWPEPPPFPRANNHASFTQPIPADSYPTAALNLQFQILQRARQDQGFNIKGLGKGFPFSPEMRWMAALNMRSAPFSLGKGKGKNIWFPMTGMTLPMMPPRPAAAKNRQPERAALAVVAKDSALSAVVSDQAASQAPTAENNAKTD